MKKIILGIGLLTASSLFFNSCEKVEEEEKTIQGKWNVDKSVVLGQTILGTGSYLKFGMSYRLSDILMLNYQY